MFQIIEIYHSLESGSHEEVEAPGPKLLARVENLRHKTAMVTLITFIIIIFALLAVLLKENNFLAKITKYIPVSGIFIILGIIAALSTHLFEEQFQNRYSSIVITSDVFQHVMIFPILLCTSYTLYNQQLLRQATSVLLVAVLGTILNVILTGVVLK